MTPNHSRASRVQSLPLRLGIFLLSLAGVIFYFSQLSQSEPRLRRALVPKVPQARVLASATNITIDPCLTHVSKGDCSADSQCDWKNWIVGSQLKSACFVACPYFTSRGGGPVCKAQLQGGSPRCAWNSRCNTCNAPNDYPQDLFCEKERQGGAIGLHVIGVLYMFSGLAIVCDEYFVPALEVITERFGISDDVAGATFMAAGGSAPELFTSFMGTFVSRSNVGFGTIVGSAVFNVLFVIGMCAVFSKELLKLTWWPLFRDSIYYALSLGVLAAFFSDSVITWVEATLLLVMYFGYVTFMKYNQNVRRAILRWRGQVADDPAGEDGNAVLPFDGAKENGSAEFPLLLQPTTFRAGVFKTLIHHIDPRGKGPTLPRDKRFHRASNMVLHNVRVSRGTETNSGIGLAFPPSPPSAGSGGTMDAAPRVPAGNNGAAAAQAQAESKKAAEEEEEEENLVAWPTGRREQVSYLLLAPLVWGMHLTIPDVRVEKWAAFYPVSFVMSILWIGFLSYFMVWWATLIGQTWGIPDPVMGLTVLAAGTSIPDLFSSVIVARQGLGDMAVSSSIGSNIFDVLVGLPLPWLTYTLISGQPLSVGGTALLSSVMILMIMLLLVIGLIMMSGWKMTKGLGYTMFVLYIVFVAQNLMVEYRIFSYGF